MQLECLAHNQMAHTERNANICKSQELSSSVVVVSDRSLVHEYWSMRINATTIRVRAIQRTHTAMTMTQIGRQVLLSSMHIGLAYIARGHRAIQLRQKIVRQLRVRRVPERFRATERC